MERQKVAVYASGKADLASYIATGGNYIGIGRTGFPFATDAGLLIISYMRGSNSSNGVLQVLYNSGVQVSASIASGDFYISGFWPTPSTTAYPRHYLR